MYKLVERVKLIVVRYLKLSLEYSGFLFKKKVY